jgi:ATP-dependent RNA helicase DeaD
MSEEIRHLASRYMQDTIEISAEQYVDPSKLTQVYYDVDDRQKFSLLKQLIEKEDSKLVMIFCNSRRNVDFVAKNLNFNNIEVLPIHGGFSQNKRNEIMEKFHSRKVHILVCTDVAARGLDIPGVTHVYNYEVPRDSKEYLHRIGRTARAGKEGKVINLISSRDYENFGNMLQNKELYIKKEETPEIESVRVKLFEDKRENNFRGNNRRTPNRGSRNSRSRNNNFSRRPRR